MTKIHTFGTFKKANNYCKELLKKEGKFYGVHLISQEHDYEPLYAVALHDAETKQVVQWV